MVGFCERDQKILLRELYEVDVAKAMKDKINEQEKWITVGVLVAWTGSCVLYKYFGAVGTSLMGAAFMTV